MSILRITTFLCLSSFFRLSLATVFAQGQDKLTITERPESLVAPDESVNVSWREAVTARLKFGRLHGSYPNTTTSEGLQSLALVPNQEGMSEAGVYFCVLESGTSVSEEFVIIVEGQTAPQMNAPANQSTVNAALTTFVWDPVPGVPYFHILVSDEEIILEDDEFGELQVANANIIWQAITPQTTIRYGARDPSEFFGSLNVNVPPLVPDVSYNWIVLNNYGNNPALSSVIQGGVSGFTVGVNAAVSAPELLLPTDASALIDDPISFEWSSAPAAVNYRIFLYEERKQSGSVSTFPIWSATTSATSIDFPSTAFLRDTQYYWRVYAFDSAGLARASERFGFRFLTAFADLEIRTRDAAGQTLPRTNVTIETVAGSPEPADLITLERGALEMRVQPGSYRVRGSKPGFIDTSQVVDLVAGETATADLLLRRASGTVSGRVVNSAEQPINGAIVHLRHTTTGAVFQTQTDPAGNFMVSLEAAEWSVFAQKSNHQNSDTVTVRTTAGSKTSLLRSLVLTINRNRVHGTVTNELGQPIFSADVIATKNETSVTSQTDAAGSFDLSLADGRWTVTAAKTGFSSPIPRQVEVKRGETISLSSELVLTTNPALLTGFVTSGRKPLTKAKVVATGHLGGAFETQTNPQGSYQFSLPAGSYAIAVQASGYASGHEKKVTLSPGQSLSGLDFRVTEIHSLIQGRTFSEGKTVGGVTVRAGTAETVSGDDGRYLLHVEAGVHTVHATKSGLVSPAPIEVTVDIGGTSVGNDFHLRPNAAHISGRVLSQSTAIVGAKIEARQGAAIFETASGFDGSFALDLDGGNWTVTADKYGFLPATLTGIVINPGQSVQGLDFNLTSNVGEVRGHVRDETGQPVPAATVRLTNQSISTLTDRSGQFALTLEPRQYELVASKRHVVSDGQSVDVSNGATEIVDFSLQTGGTLRGQVKDSDGRLLEAIAVTASGPVQSSTETDFNGRYQLLLPTGNYSLRVDGLGYQEAESTRLIESGTTVIEDFTLTAASQEIGQITGEVLNSLNAALPESTLRLSSGETLLFRSRRDGSYRSPKLRAGAHYILQPLAAGRFFIPEKRQFSPLSAGNTDADFSGHLYGDVSSNEQISSFDGSLVLRYSARQDVAPFFQAFERDSIAADVSGNGQISSFDASLVFRYSVDLLSFFPVEQSLAKTTAASEQGIATLQWFNVSPAKAYAVVHVSAARNLFATELNLWFDHSSLTPTDILLLQTEHDLAFSLRRNRIFVATAGAHPSDVDGAFLKILFNKKSVTVRSDKLLSLEKILFNESELAVPSEGSQITRIPREFALEQNYPNPFNLETTLEYDVPVTSEIRIRVYNLLGQRVTELVDKPHQPGFYEITWNGMTGDGEVVSSGVYFVRMEARRQETFERFSQIRKVLLVK